MSQPLCLSTPVQKNTSEKRVENLTDTTTDTLDAETRQRVESLIKEEEGDANQYKGTLGVLLTVTAVLMSLFHLYAAYSIVPAQILRTAHVTMVLVFIFLTFPIAARFKNRLMVWDIVFALLAIATLVYALMGGDNFTDRNTYPFTTDIVFGGILILLILFGRISRPPLIYWTAVCEHAIWALKPSTKRLAIQ